MATYEILQDEGMNYVRITIEDETVRAESGALSYLRGDISVDAGIPSIRQYYRALLSNESVVRPAYTGTGVIFLEATYSGYHYLDLEDEAWIVQGGAYWASDGNVELTVKREPMWTSIRAGEGIWDYATKVSGRGRVVLNAPGPVKELAITGERVAVSGRIVLARTDGVSYRVRRVTRSRLSHYLAGEGLARIYEGEGRVLVSAVPYWRHALWKDALQ